LVTAKGFDFHGFPVFVILLPYSMLEFGEGKTEVNVWEEIGNEAPIKRLQGIGIGIWYG